MKKFSTALFLSAALALDAALPAHGSDAKLAPQARLLPQAAHEPAPADAGWPRAVVLDGGLTPLAIVAGDARGTTRLLVAGQALRLAPATALPWSSLSVGRRLPLYRPGPALAAADGREDLGRLAFYVGSADVIGTPGAGQPEARIVRSEREIVAGDLVFDSLAPAAGAKSMAGGIDARVAPQRGADRTSLAVAGQVLALDRGAQDGVQRGMCLRAAACGEPGNARGAVAGRILHAGARASAAQLAQLAQLAQRAGPLEAGHRVCIALCPD